MAQADAAALAPEGAAQAAVELLGGRGDCSAAAWTASIGGSIVTGQA